jgi:site-specific DNA recombinase
MIRTQHKLEIIPEEANIIKLIFNKFIEEKSLTKVVSYLLRNGIKSKTNTDYSRFAVKAILENPVYAPNDIKIYDYFNDLGSEIFSEKSEFNGKHGMMVYNKTSQELGKVHSKKDSKEWIVAIGKHKPLVSCDTWLEAQRLLGENNSKAYRKPKSNNAVLSGLLRCGECGAFMRPKADNRRKTPDGETRFTYKCEMKAASNKSRCSMRDVNGNKLDKMVIEKVKEICKDNERIFKGLKKNCKAELENQKTYKAELQQLMKARKEAEKAIENGNKNMLIDMSPETAKGIIEVIEAKRKELETLNINISKIEEAISASELTLSYFDKYIEIYSDFGNNFDKLDAIEKNRMLRTIVEKIIWNGEVPAITMIGANEATADNDAPQCEDSK